MTIAGSFTSTVCKPPSISRSTRTLPLVAGLAEGQVLDADDVRTLAELPSRDVLDTAGDLLRALAAPVRIAIVLQLRESARCVHELVDALAVPQPLVSQHLRILKAAGVVAGERSGREVMYRLVDHHLADIVVAAVTHAAEGG